MGQLCFREQKSHMLSEPQVFLVPDFDRFNFLNIFRLLLSNHFFYNLSNFINLIF